MVCFYSFVFLFFLIHFCAAIYCRKMRPNHLILRVGNHTFPMGFQLYYKLCAVISFLCSKKGKKSKTLTQIRTCGIWHKRVPIPIRYSQIQFLVQSFVNIPNEITLLVKPVFLYNQFIAFLSRSYAYAKTPGFLLSSSRFPSSCLLFIIIYYTLLYTAHDSLICTALIYSFVITFPYYLLFHYYLLFIIMS